MKTRLIYPSSLLIGFLFAIVFIWNSSCHSSRSSSVTKEKTSNTFTFYVLGDWGVKGQAHQLPVADAMIRESRITKPSLILTVGDNFYENGVENLQDEHWKLSYENVYKELTRKYPWYIAPGNHDYRGNMDAQLQYHSINPNWNMPALYYSFVKSLPGNKKIRFVIIDTDPYITSYYSDPLYISKVKAQDTARQTRWVDSVLASSGEKWKIVLGHHPLYYANATNPQHAPLYRAMEPLFQKYKVQAYIAGHVHDNQYNLPKDKSVAYIISGAGAKSISTAPKSDYTIYSSFAPAFTSYTISQNTMTVKFIDTTGTAIYQNTIHE